MILKVFQCQRIVIVIGFHPIVESDTLSAPERTTLETIMAFFTSFVAFSHLTPVVLHSLIANTSSKLLIRKFVGQAFRFPLSGALNSCLHSGHAIYLVRHSFVESHSDDEGKNYANTVTVLDRCTCSYTQNMITIHEGCSTRFEYPC